MKLYDIPVEIEKFEDRLINGGGELTPELEAEWSNFVSQGKDKIEAAAFVITGIKGDIEKCKTEVSRLQSRAQSSQRNVDRLRDLTLFALKAFGGKVKTSLVTLWVGRTGKQVSVATKEGTDLAEISKTHPHLVRVKYEPNLEAAKGLYEPIWEAYEAERVSLWQTAGEAPTQAVIDMINTRLDLKWKQLLEASGLPDCFTLSVSQGTEYLRIK